MHLLAPVFLALAASATVIPNIRSKAQSIPQDALLSLAQTALTQYVTVANTSIAYRRFGTPSTVPVIYLTHLRGSMDVTDPLFLNNIAASREIIIVDYPGVGHSSGSFPSTIDSLATTVVGFLSAISVPQADVLGFSMGGMVAQLIALDHPQVVRNLILSGTQPGAGPGVTVGNTDVLLAAGGSPDVQPTEEVNQFLFFADTPTSKAAGSAWQQRIAERNVPGENRTEFLVGPGVAAQIGAIAGFAGRNDTFARLADITFPVLVTNGKTDVLAPTINSFVVQQTLQDGYLSVYPDSGHGHLFQFPALYAELLELFLRD